MLEQRTVQPSMREVKCRIPVELWVQLRATRTLRGRNYSDVITIALERHFLEERRMDQWERSVRGSHL